ncbi:MAG: hypothetical protein J5925_03090 [Clostridia bacterium]|nr:hypothetical protein [Clostridia bacterium]
MATAVLRTIYEETDMVELEHAGGWQAECPEPVFGTESDETYIIEDEVYKISDEVPVPTTERTEEPVDPELEAQRQRQFEKMTGHTINYGTSGSSAEKEYIIVDNVGELTYVRVPKEVLIIIKEIPPVIIDEDGNISLYGIQLESFYAQGMGVSLFLEGKTPFISCLATLLNVEDEEKALTEWNSLDIVEAACLNIGYIVPKE